MKNVTDNPLFEWIVIIISVLIMLFLPFIIYTIW
jgi:hypothetical protein